MALLIIVAVAKFSAFESNPESSILDTMLITVGCNGYAGIQPDHCGWFLRVMFNYLPSLLWQPRGGSEVKEERDDS